ncbi:hypothetical protein CU669_20390 [Paramagnetospirillum kuznetsovii]|uniref:Uncharacterized protein n=1 Tax=Paramagnetospirillum kuznetsovii TaxID=2053833 RepID=A0A364NT49_9PROT|nr:hypothetical protein CU669_20390 [Paramagnetospirillum kuznetsovii]
MQGKWEPSRTYYGPSEAAPFYPVVEYKGSSYVCTDPEGTMAKPPGKGWVLFAAKGTPGAASSGGGAAIVTDATLGFEAAAMAVRLDFIDESTFYRGEAVPGTAESAAGWRIKLVTFGADGDVTEQWAGGTAAYDKVWADRLTLIYV